tara:strand:- start:51 stop:1556 length:1506 start_codon:yes stop_codon:yes gene_type:complete
LVLYKGSDNSIKVGDYLNIGHTLKSNFPFIGINADYDQTESQGSGFSGDNTWSPIHSANGASMMVIDVNGGGQGSLTFNTLAHGTSTSSKSLGDMSPLLHLDAINTRVGIGTTDPEAKLHVKGGSICVHRTFPDTPDAGIVFMEDHSNKDCMFIAYDAGGTAETDDERLSFYSKSAGGADPTISGANLLMCMRADGNVGIGTTSPESLLHVQPTSTNNAFIKAVRHNDLSSTKAIFAVSEYQMTGMSSPGTIIGNHNRDIHIGAVFGAGNVLDGTTDGIRITSTSNVGIGTTSPDHKLHVSAGDDSISYHGPNASWSSYLAVGSGTDKTIANDTTIAQCITTNGNLHLDGAHSRSIYLNHYSGTTVYYQSTVIHGSDDRLKSEEELITNATETLLKLSPQKYKKAYTLREDESREPFVESGLMAQDVWYDAPELRHLVHLGADASPVDTKPEAPVDGDIQQDPDYSSWGTETAALNYDGLIAYLIKSNQELHARIQALENA